MMNHLKVELYPINEIISVTRFLIDDIDLLDRFEHRGSEVIGLAYQNKGIYEGLPTRSLPQLSKHLLGNPDPERDYLVRGKIAIYVCPACLDETCGALLVKISIDEHKVVWSDFEDRHNQYPQLGSLGPFTFDRREYEAAILNAKVVEE